MQPPCTFRSGQRESVYNENCLLTSTNKVMTTEFQSTGLQHGFVNQSYQQPSLSQTIPNFSKEPYVSPLMVRTFHNFCYLYLSLSTQLIQYCDASFRWGVMYKELIMDQQIIILIFKIIAFILLCTHQLIPSFLPL